MANTKKIKSKTAKVKLEFPVEFDGEEITSLEIKRPKFRHLKSLSNMDNPTGEDMGKLISKLSGQPMDVIDELDAVDIEEIGEVIDGFLQRGRKSGKSRA